MTRVILASKSTARSQLLRDAGVAFETVDSGVDEDAAKAELLAESATPRQVAGVLAELKALSVSQTAPGLVIAADQTLDLEGRLFDKAASVDEARDRLRLLRGRTHELHAAVTVAMDGKVIWRTLETAFLSMRPFSDAFLETYLARNADAALSSVGCYRLEGEGVQLFDRIEGDYFTILGLPLLGLLEVLREHGALPA